MFQNQGYFKKLILSYAAIICIVVCVVGIIPYTGYFDSYTKELNAINAKVVNYLRLIINEQILSKVDKIYGAIVLEEKGNAAISNFLTKSQPDDTDIVEIYAQLRNYVATSDNIIESIHLYSYQNGASISSNYGYKGKNNQTIERDYIQAIEATTKKQIWMPPHTVYSSPLTESDPQQLITKVFQFSIGHADGLLAIDISEDTLFQYIMPLAPKNSDYVFLASESGSVLCHQDKSLLSTKLTPEFDEVLSGKESGNYSTTISGESTIVSFTSIPISGWKIISVANSNTFYPLKRKITWILSLVILAGIFVGLFLAFIFSRRISAPVKRLMEQFKSGQDANENLDYVVTDIIGRMSDLTQYVEQNEEIIRNTFIINCYYDSFSGPDALLVRSNILSEDFFCGCYVSGVIYINKDISQETMLSYEVIKRLNQNVDPYHLNVAEIGNYKIAFIAALPADLNSQHLDSHLLAQLNGLENHITLFISSTTTQIENLPELFQQVRRMYATVFFYPNRKVLYYTDVRHKLESSETSDEPVLDYDHIEDHQIEQAVMLFIEAVVQSDCDTEAANRILLDTLSRIASSAYSKGIHLSSYQNIATISDKQTNILTFQTLLIEILQEYIEKTEQLLQNKNYALMENIKHYIATHFEQDVTLTTLAEHVGLTPSYLSKIFKAETGVTISNYIRDVKLEKAERLLLETDLTIEAIAEKLDYNTTHYFIRIFKERYGQTPKAYRQITKFSN